jgi:signal transduction histidine kinase
MGYTDLLLEGEFGPLTAEQAEISRRVDRSAQVLRDLVNGTLDLSRLDSGRLPLSLRDLDMLDLISEVDAETREQRAKPGVTFRWETPAQLPRVYSDPLKIKVILKNLIANAIKFTSKGDVSVAIAPAHGGLELTISDTGVGIGPDILPQIFEPFRQGEQHTTRQFGGVGLGLYLVRRLVEVLGGTVDVESTRGIGSVFRVWLPLIHPSRETPNLLQRPTELRWPATFTNGHAA